MNKEKTKQVRIPMTVYHNRQQLAKQINCTVPEAFTIADNIFAKVVSDERGNRRSKQKRRITLELYGNIPK